MRIQPGEKGISDLQWLMNLAKGKDAEQSTADLPPTWNVGDKRSGMSAFVHVVARMREREREKGREGEQGGCCLFADPTYVVTQSIVSSCPFFADQIFDPVLVFLCGDEH